MIRSHSRSSYSFDKHIPAQVVKGLNRRCRRGAKKMHNRKSRYAYRRYAVAIAQLIKLSAFEESNIYSNKI